MPAFTLASGPLRKRMGPRPRSRHCAYRSLAPSRSAGSGGTKNQSGSLRSDGIASTARRKSRRPSLFAAEESVSGRTLELRDQLLVVPAVRGLPVHAAEALAPAGDVGVVDAKQRSRPYARTKLRVGPRGDDVADRDRSLIELAPFELPHRGERRQPLNLQRQSLSAQNDEALRATHEPERARHESRCRADDCQCVRKAAPGIGEPYVQSRGRRCRDRGVGEEPARRRAVEVLDPSQGGGDRRSRTAGERPASEVVRCCPRCAETRTRPRRSTGQCEAASSREPAPTSTRRVRQQAPDRAASENRSARSRTTFGGPTARSADEEGTA